MLCRKICTNSAFKTNNQTDVNNSNKFSNKTISLHKNHSVVCKVLCSNYKIQVTDNINNSIMVPDFLDSNMLIKSTVYF